VQTNFPGRRAAAIALALTVFSACKDSTGVPELNNITTDAISSGVDRSSTRLILTGLLDRDRGSFGQRYITFSSTMARDVYRLDSAEPRWVTELLVNAPDAGGFVGAGAFADFFNVIRTANTLIDNLPTAKRADLAPQFQLNDAEIAGVAGVARTIKAQAFYRALEMRDTVGLPIDVNQPAGADLAPFRCKKDVLAYISALLDTAQTNLTAAGSSFYFTLPAGFSATNAGVDLTTPANFAKFNRALKGKVELYRGLNGDATAYARALTALNASYLSTTGSMDLGPVYTYSAAPGETVNPTYDNNIFANPKAVAAIDAADARKAKLFATGSSTRYGFTGSPRLQMTRTAVAANQTRNRRILSNEELILLRAQVEIEQNDFVNALADINVVRGKYGLPTIVSLPDKEAFRTAVLYEKRYSLFYEGAQRLVDLRAYDRFKEPYLVKENASDAFVRTLPIPKAELDQRGGSAPKTCS
jgi:starch-binding outer membrane protein, SusD/RagB family